MKINLKNSLILSLIGFPMLLTSSAQVLGDVNLEQNTCLDLKYNMSFRSRDVVSNGEVTELQDFLQDRGYLMYNPSGFFGAATRSAVIKFQKDNNILAQGMVGSVTRAKIKEVTCRASLSNSQNNVTINNNLTTNQILNNVVQSPYIESLSFETYPIQDTGELLNIKGKSLDNATAVCYIDNKEVCIRDFYLKNNNNIKVKLPQYSSLFPINYTIAVRDESNNKISNMFYTTRDSNVPIINSFSLIQDCSQKLSLNFKNGSHNIYVKAVCDNKPKDQWMPMVLVDSVEYELPSYALNSPCTYWRKLSNGSAISSVTSTKFDANWSNIDLQLEYNGPGSITGFAKHWFTIKTIPGSNEYIPNVNYIDINIKVCDVYNYNCAYSTGKMAVWLKG
jgi:hypothetical protein